MIEQSNHTLLGIFAYFQQQQRLAIASFVQMLLRIKHSLSLSVFAAWAFV